MRIVFLATGSFAIPTLKQFSNEDSDIKIACVVTQPDRPRGRGRMLSPTPVKAAALELGFRMVEAADVNDADQLELARSLHADVGVVIDFGQKVGAEYRAAFRGGCVNLHASLLPAYRGAAPFQWAIINGEAKTGVTVFGLVNRMDAGPVFSQMETDLSPDETADDLHDRLAEMGPETVLRALRLFEGDRIPEGEVQDESRATKAPKLSKADGRIDFCRPAVEIVRRIHGTWSWPGASCRFESADGARSEIVTVARARVDSCSETGGDVGMLNDDLLVATGDGRVEFMEIKPQGGRLMSFRDFVNGRRVVAGDRFATIT
jgi:methionyl-tRNA formyltransferase